MSTIETAGKIHPLGDGNFSFPTAGGPVKLSVTDDALTPYGGLAPWTAYTKHLGLIDKLTADCPVSRTSPNASLVYDFIQSFMLTALTDGRRFSHIERLREYPTIPELFGMESVVSDDSVRRFFKSVDPVLGAEWIARRPTRCGARCPIQLCWTGIRPSNPSTDIRKERKWSTIQASLVGAVFILCWV